MSEAVCVDCEDAKAKAEAKAKAAADNGLQLGACSLLYSEWAECVERQQGQVTACKEELAAFRSCHRGLQQQGPNK